MQGLERLVGGRVEAALLVPDTGLVALRIWTVDGERWLGAGVGPRLVGLGWLPRAPRYAASSRHPLVAALRAHVVDHRVRHVDLDDEGALWLAVGGEGAVARVRLFPAPAGEARVVDATGQLVVRWSAGRLLRAVEPEGDPDAVGAELVRLSDALLGEQRRAQLVKALQGQAKKLARRREAVQADLERLEDVPRLQRLGRMLLVQGARVPRGATQATLEDWEEGGTLTVPLDPARPAKLQAEGFFQKARRMQRGEAVMRARLAEAGHATARVRELLDGIVAAGTLDPATLEAWTRRARELGVPVAGPGAPGRAAPRGAAAKRQPYIEYQGWRDRAIYVGKGARDNDALTLGVARPQDLWLHVRGEAGAHVVVPLDKGSSCPPELLVDAATLAAYHSDARGRDLVEVQYVERRHVRKGKNLPAGKVVLEREKVLPLRVEPARLERLLASRKE